MPLWFLLSLSNFTPHESIKIVTDIDYNTLFLQIISIQIFLSAIRLASFNTSSMLSTSMSLFSSIILSSLAVETGLLKAEVVFYASLSSICCYCISNYETSRAISFWNFILILSVGLFNKIGFIITSTILFLSVVTIRYDNTHYLYPFIPFNLKSFGSSCLMISFSAISISLTDIIKDFLEEFSFGVYAKFNS
mgnify:CR=1 FL=1